MFATTFTQELSIVIVAWNGRDFVQECLASLQCQAGGISTEIILVDNGSSDGTPDMVRDQFLHVHLVQNKRNEGFAKANNVGMRLSGGKYICLVNSDVVLPPDCLLKMHSFMEQHPTVGVLGPRMLRPDGCVGRSYMRFPSVWRCLCDALTLHVLFKGWKGVGGILMRDFRNGSTSDVDVLNGWFLMVRRAALVDVGALDEQFFMYAEDIDWSYRFHVAGWRRVYFAGAEALHYGGASSAAAPVRFHIAMQQANLQLYRKHNGRIRALGYLLTMWLHEICRVAGYGVIFVVKQSSRADAAAKVRRSISCLWWLCGMRRAEEARTQPKLQ
jgi:GT2 family glycosyltransferase